MCQHPQGIEIQFTVFMMAYLLLVAFKQDCHRAVDAEPFMQNADSQTAKPLTDHAESQLKTASKSSDPPQLQGASTTSSEMSGTSPIHNAYEFVALLGERLEKYWKIGIHWLVLSTPGLKNFARS